MAENLRMLDQDMLTAVIEFDQMHEGYDYKRLFPLITCPVLIIQGSPAHGGLLTTEEVEQALTMLPHARLVRMESVGHPLHTLDKNRCCVL
jgi:pimeloyl-ACP methyl ester carboxylesterase